jgi:hypothetical protein
VKAREPDEFMGQVVAPRQMPWRGSRKIDDVVTQLTGGILNIVGTEGTELTEIWRQTEASLPAGWKLDSLRCASEGLEPDQRSADWIAIAVGPTGEELRARVADPIAALLRLIPLVPNDALPA